MPTVKTQARGNEARAKIYVAVASRWREGGYSPTIREIATETNYSVASVHRHVRILIEQGSLHGRGRTLRPTRSMIPMYAVWAET